MSTHRFLGIPAAALSLALLFGLAGCSGGSASGVESAPEVAAPAAADTEGASSAEGASAGDAKSADDSAETFGSEGTTSAAERKIARTATLTLVITNPAESAAQLRQVAEASGGYLLSESIVTEQRNGQYQMSSSMMLAVPSEKLDQSLDDFAQVGTVTRRTVTGQDVTAAVVDVEARIKVLRESIARVEKLMNSAGSISEIAKIEAELTSRQEELESMVARQRRLANSVEMAPVTITLKPAAVVTNEQVDPALVLVGVMIPVLIVAGAIVVAIVLRRRREGSAAESAGTASGAKASGDAHAASDDESD